VPGVKGLGSPRSRRACRASARIGPARTPRPRDLAAAHLGLRGHETGAPGQAPGPSQSGSHLELRMPTSLHRPLRRGRQRTRLRRGAPCGRVPPFGACGRALARGHCRRDRRALPRPWRSRVQLHGRQPAALDAAAGGSVGVGASTCQGVACSLRPGSRADDAVPRGRRRLGVRACTGGTRAGAGLRRDRRLQPVPARTARAPRRKRAARRDGVERMRHLGHERLVGVVSPGTAHMNTARRQAAATSCRPSRGPRLENEAAGRCSRGGCSDRGRATTPRRSRGGGSRRPSTTPMANGARQSAISTRARQAGPRRWRTRDTAETVATPAAPLDAREEEPDGSRRARPCRRRSPAPTGAPSRSSKGLRGPPVAFQDGISRKTEPPSFPFFRTRPGSGP
jgi:hypothetical protein